MDNQIPKNDFNNQSQSVYNRPFIIEEKGETVSPASPEPVYWQQNFPTAEALKEQERKKEIKRLGNIIGGGYLLFKGISFVLLLLIYGVMYLLNGMGGVATNVAKFMQSDDGLLVLNAIVYTAIIGFLIIPAKLKKSPSDMVDFGRFDSKKGFYSILAGLGFCVIGNFVSSYIAVVLERVGISPKGGDFELGSSPYSLIIGIIAVGVFPAMLEELTTRGFVIGALKDRFNPTPVILISACLFGLWHGNLVQIPFAFCAGIAFGFIYYYTGSVWPSIIVHFINNVMSVVLTYIQKDMDMAMAELMTLCVFAVLLLLGIVGFYKIVSNDKAAFSFKNQIVPERKKTVLTDVRCFFSAPCIILFLIATVFDIVLAQLG